MNSFTQLVQNVKDANWQRAGQVFKEIMQQKVADRIDIERRTIFKEDGSEAYKKHFDSMLKKWNVTSPADIPDDKKDDFFKAVDAGYTAKNEADHHTTPGAAHAAYYKQHKITHIVAKKDLAAHKKWMDSEGFDTHTVPLPDNDRDAKTHVGVVSKGNVESSYHVDGFAQPIKEG